MSERIGWAGTLQRWGGESAAANWFYVIIDGDAAEALSATALMRRLELGRSRGFGSIKLAVTIGVTRWSTSAFPQKDGNWLLPVKAPVRRAEGLAEGDPVELEFEI